MICVDHVLIVSDWPNDRLLWRGLAEIDPESIEDPAVREVAMEEVRMSVSLLDPE